MRAGLRIPALLVAVGLCPACDGGGPSEGGSPAATTENTQEIPLEPVSPAEAGLGGTQSPFIRITSPASGATCPAGSTVTLMASAVDPDAILARVDFFDGSRYLGGRPTAPFTWPWAAMTEGAHILSAVAYDIQGFVTTSAPVTVFVIARGAEVDDPRRTRK